MSTDVKVRGALVLESESDVEDLAFEVDSDDAASREVEALLDDGLRVDDNILRFDIDASLSADANLALHDWLGDLATAAESGHLDTWQESNGPSKFVRLHAGGEEEVIDEPFAEA